jgi:shikimate 5-dehydrogenase
VAAGLDYRCLTLDVSPEDLACAIAGMRAMGFLGAVFAPPHQVEVAKYLDQVVGENGEPVFVDYVVREGDQLIGDCLLGVAIGELLKKLDKMPQSALIVGGTPREQMVAKQLVRLGLEVTVVSDEDSSVPLDDDNSHPHVLSDASMHDENGHQPSSADESSSDAILSSDGTEDDENGTVGNNQNSLDAADDAAKVIQPKVFKGPRMLRRKDYESLPQPAEFVLQASQRMRWPAFLGEGDGLRSQVAIDLTEDPVQTEFLRSAKLAGFQVFNSVDVRLMTLVIAFRRWTNIEPDDSIMRDALEEFLLV